MLFPGQPVNILEVPIEMPSSPDIGQHRRSYSTLTLNPKDRYKKLRRPFVSKPANPTGFPSELTGQFQSAKEDVRKRSWGKAHVSVPEVTTQNGTRPKQASESYIGHHSRDEGKIVPAIEANVWMPVLQRYTTSDSCAHDRPTTRQGIPSSQPADGPISSFDDAITCHTMKEHPDQLSESFLQQRQQPVTIPTNTYNHHLSDPETPPGLSAPTSPDFTPPWLPTPSQPRLRREVRKLLDDDTADDVFDEGMHGEHPQRHMVLEERYSAGMPEFNYGEQRYGGDGIYCAKEEMGTVQARRWGNVVTSTYTNDPFGRQPHSADRNLRSSDMHGASGGYGNVATTYYTPPSANPIMRMDNPFEATISTRSPYSRSGSNGRQQGLVGLGISGLGLMDDRSELFREMGWLGSVIV